MIALAFTFLMVYCGFKAICAYIDLKSWERREKLRNLRRKQWRDRLNGPVPGSGTNP